MTTTERKVADLVAMRAALVAEMQSAEWRYGTAWYTDRQAELERLSRDIRSAKSADATARRQAGQPVRYGPYKGESVTDDDEADDLTSWDGPLPTLTDPTVRDADWGPVPSPSGEEWGPVPTVA